MILKTGKIGSTLKNSMNIGSWPAYTMSYLLGNATITSKKPELEQIIDLAENKIAKDDWVWILCEVTDELYNTITKQFSTYGISIDNNSNLKNLGLIALYLPSVEGIIEQIANIDGILLIEINESVSIDKY